MTMHHQLSGTLLAKMAASVQLCISLKTPRNRIHDEAHVDVFEVEGGRVTNVLCGKLEPVRVRSCPSSSYLR